MTKPHMRILIVVAALCALFAGCAASNLTGIAKVNQQITLTLSDACTIANQAKAAYEAQSIPQTATARTIINDAGVACEQGKLAFNLTLQAEIAYSNAEIAQVSACSPQVGASASGTPPAQQPACLQANQTVTSTKGSLDAATANLDAKLNDMAVKSNAARAITPK